MQTVDSLSQERPTTLPERQSHGFSNPFNAALSGFIRKSLAAFAWRLIR